MASPRHARPDLKGVAQCGQEDGEQGSVITAGQRREQFQEGKPSDERMRILPNCHR
jgi:hypothetical protein